MQRRTYFKNAAILTGTSLLLRAAGMFFRVYIAGRIGAEGMGVYQLITTVYSMAITLATAGLSIAATRVCADLMAAGDERRVRSAMGRVLLLGVGLGVLASVVLWFGAPLAAELWLKDLRAARPLRILAPSLPFMAMSAVLRGYFLARRKVEPNARAQVFEQIVRISFVMALLTQVTGVEASCAAVVAGNTISEAASWTMMVLFYRKDAGTLKKGPVPSHLGRKLWNILAPISANQYLTSVLRTVENVMVPGCLALYTLSRETALSQYGALKGMAMPVLFFPFSLLGTLSTLLMPEIAETHVRGATQNLQRLTERVMTITMTLGILAGGLFTVFAYPIAEVLYHSEEIGFYLAILGPLAPLMYMESMVDGVLKGLNEQLSSFRYSVADSVVRIVLIALLLPRFGMKGFLFVMLVSNLLTSLLNLHRLLTVTGLRLRVMRWAVWPAALVGVAGFAWRYAGALLVAGWPVVAQLVAGGVFVTALYALLGFLTGLIRPEEWWLQRQK